MEHYHPTSDDLRRFQRGGLEAPLAGRIQEHLHRGCARCAGLLRRLAAPGCDGTTERSGTLTPVAPTSFRDAAPPPDSPYEAAFDRVFARVRRLDEQLHGERREASEKVRSLLAQPTPRRLLLVRNSPSFRTLGVAEALLEAASEARFDDPRETLERCEVALQVATSLPVEPYGWRLLEDLRGRIWAHLGNARRIRADFPAARQAFQASHEHLARGTGCSLGRAEWLHLKAILVRDEGDLQTASTLLEEALELYRDEDHLHEAGVVLLALGQLAQLGGRHRRHRALLQDALGLIDAGREPRAVLAAVHNLASSLQDEGRNQEALALLVSWRHLYFEVGGRTSLLRLHWLEGLIARDLGRDEAAEGALRQARRGFLDLDMAFEGALVSLDMALLYVSTGRQRDAAELAAATAALFDSHGTYREAGAALLVLTEAARRDQASHCLVDEVGRFLEEVRENPDARFRPADGS